MPGKNALLALAAACSLTLAVQAQDTTVKSKTQIKTDDAKTVTLSGCLQQGTDPGTWTLSAPAKADDKKEVGTAGAVTTYMLTPKDGVDLTAHVGHRVQITAVEIPAKTATDDDAKIEIKDKTTIKKEDAPDEKIKTKTKAEIERGPLPKLTVVTIKHVAPSCM